MAILDAFTQVSTNQAITSSIVVSTNVIDLNSVGLISGFRDIGLGNEIVMRMKVTETFLSGTLLTPVVAVADDVAFTASPCFLAAIGGTTFPITGIVGLLPGELIAGDEYMIGLPPISQRILIGSGSRVGRRYLGMVYIPTGTFTAGKVTVDFSQYKGLNTPPIHAKGFSGP